MSFILQHQGLLSMAVLGGLMLNFLNLWEDYNKPKADRAPKDGLYVFFFVSWPIMGALLALVYLYDGSTLRPMLAFSIGLGAPTILKTLASTAKPPKLENVEE
jgi:hypothetical protein